MTHVYALIFGALCGALTCYVIDKAMDWITKRRRTLNCSTGEEFYSYPDGRTKHVRWWL